MTSTSNITGNWKNSKATTKTIAKFSLLEKDGNLQITIAGAAGGYLPNEIGPLSVIAHAADPDSTESIAFQAEATVDGTSYFFAGNVNKGLVIIATYIKTAAGKGSNFFIREFFYRLK